MRHSSLLRHILRILKFAHTFDGLKFCSSSKCFPITECFAHQRTDGGDGMCNTDNLYRTNYVKFIDYVVGRLPEASIPDFLAHP